MTERSDEFFPLRPPQAFPLSAVSHKITIVNSVVNTVDMPESLPLVSSKMVGNDAVPSARRVLCRQPQI